MCLSGVGRPVQHMEWRTPAEHRITIRRYEAGSGVWIGAAFRRQGWKARRYLRGRYHVVSRRIGQDLGNRDVGAAAGSALALVRGLV